MDQKLRELMLPLERIVKPRLRKQRHWPIIAVDLMGALSEDGVLIAEDELIRKIPEMPATMFAVRSAADWVAKLDQIYAPGDPEKWQWRASVVERELHRPGQSRRVTRISTVIHYFGWRHGVYHRIIDPVAMYGKTLDEICPGEETEVYRLLQWAVKLRDFCAENYIELRPTIGSTAAQFLTDTRFYSEPRRKVPAKINERVRENLPGNHYELVVLPTPKREYTAHYLDQHSAHHYHARTVALPDANHLYAYGNYITLAPSRLRVSDDFYGLYCLDLERPTRLPRFAWLRGRRLEKQFVFSNELPTLLDLGYGVIQVRAAWGSSWHDQGLARYSRFAQAELEKYGSPVWLKMLLLATYGVLAIRPSYGDTIFRMAKKGDTVVVHTGHLRLRGKHVSRTRKLEPKIANVLHRGMIEAATRAESVGLAQWLANSGQHVLSIYADAVIVKADDDKPLPFLPEPWEVKGTLNHLQFINQQAFVSDSMTKIPGIGRELRQYRQSRKPGYAPRKMAIEALTGKQIQTQKRI